MMTCKGFLEWLLKLLNLLLTLLGLAMVGCGMYLFLMHKNTTHRMEVVPSDEGLTASSKTFFDNLPTDWFIYLFIGVGAIVFVISCFRFIAAETQNRSCLTCYSLLMILLILVEVGCAAFIFFHKTWRVEIPMDKTGTIDGFLRNNGNICKWVALGAVILEAVIFLLAIMLRAANAPAEFDYTQPFISRQPVSSIACADRNDAWSNHMREKLLKLLNLLLTLLGLAMVGYGIYLFVMYDNTTDHIEVAPSNEGQTAVSPNKTFFDNLPTAWFIYLFIGVGAVVFVISCFGWIGAKTRNRCCLTCYSLLVFMLILVEVGCAAFIFFHKSWRPEIPTDKTGEFNTIYGFLRKNWNICKWVALGAVILEAVVFLLALMVRAANASVEYDSDDEFINLRQQRQPLISRQPVSSIARAVGTSDAWSTRMREKYGLDTSEFTYNSDDSNRKQQDNTQSIEEKSDKRKQD